MMGHTKHGNIVANEHRKKAASLPFHLVGYVTGNTSVNWVKSMTPIDLYTEGCVSDHTVFCVLEWGGMEAVQLGVSCVSNRNSVVYFVT